jgi:CRP-like cAMP-binding protein
VSVVGPERVKRELTLRALFPTMPVAAQVRLIELLDDLTLAPGEVAFEEGTAPDRFLFLTEGRVALEATGLRSVEFSGFSVVGVVDAILDRPRVRRCRALEPSKALVIRTVDWMDLLEDNAEIARAATKNFAISLHALWQEFAQRLPQGSEAPPGFSPHSLDTYDKILVLRQAALSRRAGMQAVASLATVAESISLRAGQSLFELGNEGSDFFIVARGLVEISHTSGFHFTHDAGDLVGGPAAFSNSLPLYAAKAVTDAVVLRIPQQEFYDQAEEHGRLVRGTLAFLATELEALQAAASPPSASRAP